jgi:hypothetical protein
VAVTIMLSDLRSEMTANVTAGEGGRVREENFTRSAGIKAVVSPMVGWPGLPFFCVYLFENLDLDRLVRHNPFQAAALVFQCA